MNLKERNQQITEVIGYLSVMVGLDSQKDRAEYASKAINVLKIIYSNEQKSKDKYKVKEFK